jgi:hypothetical protein
MLDTFAQVAERYAKTKPLGGRKNVGLDIRPLGKRRQKKERIAKIDDNCYVLTDGFNASDPIFPTWTARRVGAPAVQQKDFVDFAPIVWRMHDDGSETITLRNAGVYNSSVNSRHSFFRRYLPRGLGIANDWRDGRHFIWYHFGGKILKRYLPLTTGIPAQIFDYLKVSRINRGTRGDDGLLLTFRRDDGNWCALGDAFPVPVNRVDVQAKEEYKQAIKDFREWCLLMLPMISIDVQVSRDARLNLEKYGDSLPGDYVKSWRAPYRAEAVRNIVADYNHPNRLDLLVSISAYIESPYYPAKIDEFRKGFTRTLNMFCGWNKTVLKEHKND